MSVLGIPVKVDLYFWMVCAVLATSRFAQPLLLAEWLVVVFVSVLLHELGHALTGRAFGLTPKIHLYGLGGVTSWAEAREVSPPQSIAISLAGPVTGFLFGAVVYLLMPSQLATQGFWSTVYQDLLWVNLGWGLFNLLPVQPLDGGNVIDSLESWLTTRTGGLIARVVSLLTASGVLVWAASIRWFWVAGLLGWFAVLNGSALFQRYARHHDLRLEPVLDEIQALLDRDEASSAAEQSERLFKSARSAELKHKALDSLVCSHIEAGNFEQARLVLRNLDLLFGAHTAFRARLHFKAEEWTLALPLLEAEFKSDQSQSNGRMLVQAMIKAHGFPEVLRYCADPAQADYSTSLRVIIQLEAFYAGEYLISIEVGQRIFSANANPEVAYNISCACSKAGRIEEGLQWLARAIESGYQDQEFLARDADLDELRASPAFAQILQRLHTA